MDVALWIRVSTDQQESANQVPDLERFCSSHGHKIVKRYVLSDSAWDKGGAEYRALLQQVMDDAWRGEFQGVVTWALDRISRDGIEAVLRLVRQAQGAGHQAAQRDGELDERLGRVGGADDLHRRVDGAAGVPSQERAGEGWNGACSRPGEAGRGTPAWCEGP